MKFYTLVITTIFISLFYSSSVAQRKALVGGNVIDVKTGEVKSNATILTEDNTIIQIGSEHEVAITDGFEIIRLDGKYIIPSIYDGCSFSYNNGTCSQVDNSQLSDTSTLYNKSNYYKTINAWLGENLEAAAPTQVPLIFISIPTNFGSANFSYTGLLSDSALHQFFTHKQTVVLDFTGLEKNVAQDSIQTASSLLFNRLKAKSITWGIVTEKNYLAKEALKANVSCFVHSFVNVPIAKDLLPAMKQQHVYFIPLLSIAKNINNIYYSEQELQFADQLALLKNDDCSNDVTNQLSFFTKGAGPYQTFSTTLLLLQQNDIAIITGSGSGWPGLVHGSTFYYELSQLTGMGLGMKKMLQSITINPATMYGEQAEKGAIEPGKMADFTILNRNPLENSSALMDVFLEIKNGVIYYPTPALSEDKMQAAAEFINSWKSGKRADMERLLNENAQLMLLPLDLVASNKEEVLNYFEEKLAITPGSKVQVPVIDSIKDNVFIKAAWDKNEIGMILQISKGKIERIFLMS